MVQAANKTPGSGLKFKRNYLTSFCMGFTSGAPYLVPLTLVQSWLTTANVSLALIGAMSLVRLPYSLKILWAFWLDSYDPPVFKSLGRRRGWILISQLGVIAGLLILSLQTPTDLYAVAGACLFITFTSATQDVVVDAYRREDLADWELGAGSACYYWGYRLATLLVSGGGLMAAGYYHLDLSVIYRFVAVLMLIGPLTLLFSPEPKVDRPAPESLARTVLNPLLDFFRRCPAPLMVICFIFFYKFGDQFAATLQTTYLMTIGYDNFTIGQIVKICGTIAVLSGVALGGWGVSRLGLKASLWIFGFLQMISTLGYVVIYYLPVDKLFLGIFIAQENLAAGAGTSAFMAFMAGQTNRSFSAVQYALLSSFMALPTTLLASPSGLMADFYNWPLFFTICTVSALPGFLILYELTRKGVFAYDKFYQP